jgi:hypothetical protein
MEVKSISKIIKTGLEMSVGDKGPNKKYNNLL